ncbi:hypothetical protein B0H14DRAFT_3559356 [Mycena olivaceomarginata]|nr:hypothetical protein B0H14DRAFT_3559356 [Mycena olivaceomarginata]
MVEKYLATRWRTPEDRKERTTVAQHWSRYREIPEWIESECMRRGVAPTLVVTELEAMRAVVNPPKGLNWLRGEVEKLRKQAKRQATETIPEPSSSASPVSHSVSASASASSTPSLSTSEPSALAPAFEEDILRACKRAPAVDPRRSKKVKL